MTNEDIIDLDSPEEGNRIHRGDPSQKYYVRVLHIVHNRCRTVYDLSLWTTIAMIAGEDGECWLSKADLAQFSMMSERQVVYSRAWLIEAGLLEGGLYKEEGHKQRVWHLRIPDLWEENVAWRKKHDPLKGPGSRVALKRQQALDLAKEHIKRR
jgi:hypothetical protein